MENCTICEEEADGLTEIYIRDIHNSELIVEICDYCRQMLLAELMKQFISEKWLPMTVAKPKE